MNSNSPAVKAFVLGVAFLVAMVARAGEKEKPAPDASKAVASGAMQELKFNLPKPYFGGTPVFYSSKNFEEPSVKPRAPFMAPKGTELLSAKKPVTSSDPNPHFGKLAMVTDGEIGFQQYYLLELNAGLQWVQIDLEKPAEIYAILVWHSYAADRVYFDVVVQVSDDPAFGKNVTTVYSNDIDNSAGLGIGKDNEYVDRFEGRLIDAKGAKGRYVRLYSKGNTTDDTNHYTEVQVFGK